MRMKNGNADLALAIEAWSKVLQDIGADLYSRAFANKGLSGLSLVKFRYVELIARNPGITPAYLASLMEVSRPTVTGVINGFTRLGLVRKRRSETDRRVIHLFLTKDAREIIEFRRSLYKRAAQHAGTVLSDAERETLTRLMRKAVEGHGKRE